MPGYFDTREPECSPISREDVLMPEYIPDDISHREMELKTIADAIKPLMQKRIGENLFIIGKPGIGKTLCIKFLLRELTSSSSSVLPVYVNCWENQTKLAVYNKIIECMRLPVPRRGLAADEILDKITQYIKNYDKRVLLVLDDMDGLKNDEVLHALAKANENRVMFGVLCASNSRSRLARFDPRIRSSLRFVEFEFKQYSEEQLFSILRRRADAALIPGSYDEKLLKKIAQSVSDCSARLGLERLWRSAKRAERAGRAKIMIQDAEDGIAEEETFKKKELALCDEEKLILSVLEVASGHELDSTSLYEQLGAIKSKRQIRNYLDSLEKKKLIAITDIEKANDESGNSDSADEKKNSKASGSDDGGLLKSRMIKLSS